MALVTSGQIELIDLTDTRAAQLFLTTSLPKVQVLNGNIFSPDFTKSPGEVPIYNGDGTIGPNKENFDGLCIIPSLYFGQEFISINNFFNKISYRIPGESVPIMYQEGIDETSTEVYVNDKGWLIYKKNLLDLDSLFIVAEIEKYDDGINYYEDIQAQIELTKVSSASNYLPIIKYNRNIFSSQDKDPIILEAVLYEGGKIYEGEIKYSWTIFPKIFNADIIGTEKIQEIIRENINNIATVSCKMEVNGNEYEAQVTISDKTDPLYSQITASKALVFIGTSEEVELVCDIWRNAEELNVEDFTYFWSYLLTKEGKLTETTLITDSNSNILNVVPENYATDSITYRCVATNKTTGEVTVSQTAISISPEIVAVINPIQTFIPSTKEGALFGEPDTIFPIDISFKLTNGSGAILSNGIDPSGLTIEPVLLDGIISPFSTEVKYVDENTKNWNYIITLTLKEEEQAKEDFQKLDSSTMIKIEYNYKNVELSNEFYIIKNIQGEKGKGILQTRPQYYLSEDLDSPINGEWTYEPPEFDITKFIWTRMEIEYDDGSVEYTDPVYDATWESIGRNAIETQAELNSSIMQTKKDLTSNFSQNYVATSEFEQYKKDASSSFVQTSSDIVMNFSTIENKVTNLNNTLNTYTTEQNKWIRFSEKGIEIGENKENSLILKMSNNKISFVTNNEDEIAYFSSGRLYVNQVEAITSITLGKFAFVPTQSGNLTLKNIK